MAAPRENHVIVRHVIDQQHSLAEAAARPVPPKHRFRTMCAAETSLWCCSR